jgi:CopG family nickel-responsive transcriptional regulator
MKYVTRFGVSIDPGLLQSFDALIKSQGYNTRSEAISDLIREYLMSKTLSEEGVQAIGALFILYDHHQGILVKRLLDLQHDSTQDVLSTMHIHVDHQNCLEIIIIRGLTEEIHSFYNNIRALKGIKHSALSLTLSLDL